MLSPAAASIAHLYRRAAFGARPDELSQGVAAGYEATVERLLDRTATDAADAMPRPNLQPTDYGPKPTTEQQRLLNAEQQARAKQLAVWWIDRMAASTTPGREKLTWYWHGHFATSNEKVGSPLLMAMQSDTFRKLGGGSFEALTQAVAKDPAMMVWLDSNTNRKDRPNENFARELMELFTVGIGNYTDADVREAARAFTGWTVDKAAAAITLNRAQEDLGTKTLLGQTGDLRAEDVVSILAHVPTGPRFVTARIWSRFAFPVVTDHPVVAELAPGFANDLDVTNLLRRVFLHPKFVSADARTGLVKEPVEWVVGALRVLGLSATAMQRTNPSVLSTLDLLGQVPFQPPSVGGWPQNRYWLSSTTSLARLRFAQAMAGATDLGWLDAAPKQQRASVLGDRLGVDVWSPPTAAALAQATSSRSLLALGLVSPEYVLN